MVDYRRGGYDREIGDGFGRLSTQWIWSIIDAVDMVDYRRSGFGRLSTGLIWTRDTTNR